MYHPVTGLAPGIYMQLTDEMWVWFLQIRTLFAMLTYHKHAPIAAAMLGQRGCTWHSKAELVRRGGRRPISEFAVSAQGAVLR